VHFETHCMMAKKYRELQSNPDIKLPSLSTYESMWTELPICTVFWFTATLDIPPQIAVNLRTSLFWDFTQHCLVVSYRRFGTTYRSLKTGPIGCPETSVTNCQSAPCNIPEERKSHTICLLSWLLHRRRKQQVGMQTLNCASQHSSAEEHKTWHICNSFKPTKYKQSNHYFETRSQGYLWILWWTLQCCSLHFQGEWREREREKMMWTNIRV
jgi:hypothetical protein